MPAALALVLAALSAASDAPALADPLARFAWLRDLAGACWSGTYDDGKTSDTQCYELQWGRFVRGTIRLSGEHQGRSFPELRGDSVFAWSAKKERVVYTNWSSDGGYGAGEMLVDGGALLFPDPPREGRPESRTRWTRLGADAFQVVREVRDGEGWRPLLTAVYRRVKG